MARVRACVILFLGSPSADRIALIAQDKGVSLDDAAIAYTLGALKAAIRRCTVRTYSQALDRLEAEQMGDRDRLSYIDTMGKVMGTLYADWEAREAASDPAVAYDARADIVEANLQRYFTEYTDHLSKTTKARLYALAASTIDPRYLMSRAGQADPDDTVRSLSRAAQRLYESFPHHDAITGGEYVCFVRRYVAVPPSTT
jgi:hypothetical protein